MRTREASSLLTSLQIDSVRRTYGTATWCDPKSDPNPSLCASCERPPPPRGWGRRSVGAFSLARSRSLSLPLSLEPRARPDFSVYSRHRRTRKQRTCRILHGIQSFESFVVPVRTTSQTRGPLTSTHLHHPRRPAREISDLSTGEDSQSLAKVLFFSWPAVPDFWLTRRVTLGQKIRYHPHM